MTELKTGQSLGGRFELRSALGSGGTGQVWLAHDSDLGEDVALKILATALAGTPGQIDLLRDECRKARTLQHPNIVRVYDFHELDGRFFISMQYVPGGSLAQRRGAAMADWLPVCRMVCDALEFAHRRGIIHRDLKPANVLVDPRGIGYLTDFGIAAGLGGEGLPIRGGGSLPVISPQQLAGDEPAIADDVYGLGALLFELLAGQPLFHPGATAARVRDETPQIPVKNEAGEEIPAPLRALLSAMLQKDPASRPAGIAAVRAVLDEVAADLAPAPGAGVIRPRRRENSAPASGPVTRRARPGAPRRSLPGSWVIGGFAALVLVALGVIFLLPAMVKEPAVVSAPPPPVEVSPAAESEVSDANSSGEERSLADEALGELLVLQDRLGERSVVRWGGADWAEAERFAEEGDGHYRARDYPAAGTAYRRSLTLLKVIEMRIPEVLAQALSDGDAALLAGQRSAALDRYELALAVDPDNAAATRGLERAGRLGAVLELMSSATAKESAGQLRDAAKDYRQVLEIDPEWTPARDGLTRTQGVLVRTAYETQMAAGFEALARRDWDTSRRSFEAALQTRPGDSAAKSALQQVSAEQRLEKIVAQQARARELEAAEDWAGAVRQYEALLLTDAALGSAKQGLARSQQRAALAAELDKAIANADVLNDESKWQSARGLANQAREAKPMGAKLAAQIAALERALTVAAVPVPVRFESDSQTDVVIYKVGRLGLFQTMTLDLRPGKYVAVGSRDGFRDTRRSFLVAPDGTTPPVVVRCEEPI